MRQLVGVRINIYYVQICKNAVVIVNLYKYLLKNPNKRQECFTYHQLWLCNIDLHLNDVINESECRGNLIKSIVNSSKIQKNFKEVI